MSRSDGAQRDPFDEIYRDVPTDRRERLRRFRARHPPSHLAIGGVTWAYIAAGQGEQALLILGGAMSTAETSFRHIERYEGVYRVISPSYPPLGSLAPALDGLAAILDAEGIARAHVFCHSLGAGVAHALIRRHPEKVDRLVLSGFGLYNARSLRLARRYLRLFGLLPYGFVSGFYKRRMRQLLAGIDEGERAFLLAYMRDVLDLQHNKRTLMAQFDLLEDMFAHPHAYRVFEPVEAAGPTSRPPCAPPIRAPRCTSSRRAAT